MVKTCGGIAITTDESAIAMPTRYAYLPQRFSVFESSKTFTATTKSDWDFFEKIFVLKQHSAAELLEITPFIFEIKEDLKLFQKKTEVSLQLLRQIRLYLKPQFLSADPAVSKRTHYYQNRRTKKLKHRCKTAKQANWCNFYSLYLKANWP